MLSEIILLMLVCLEHFISNTMKYTSVHKAFVKLLAALEYLLFREDANVVQSCVALGQLWDSCSGCPL